MQPEKQLESKARRVAQKACLRAIKSRKRESANQQGGFMLIDPYNNTVGSGANFELTADDVIDFCQNEDGEIKFKGGHTRKELLDWAHEQRRDYRRGQLTAIQIRKLESLPGWTWDEQLR